MTTPNEIWANIENNIAFMQWKENGFFNDMSHIDEFLGNYDITKNLTLRVITWLISLGLISPNYPQSLQELSELYNQYTIFFNQYFPSNSNYSDIIPKHESETLKNDLIRTKLWYNQLASSENYHFSDLEKIKDCAGRILALISISNPSLSYIQGYDRYVFITLLLGQLFCEENSISENFAEAFSFYTSRALITLAQCHSFLDNTDESTLFFDNYDAIARQFTPHLQAELDEKHQGSFFYALKWHIILFADEFPFRSVLLIWDHIISNKDSFYEYMKWLFVSQIEQVEENGDRDIPPAERIQKFQNRNTVQFLIRADSLLKQKNQANTKETIRNTFISLGIIVGIMAISYPFS